MTQRRPRTADSTRPISSLKPLCVNRGSRPGSAKQWFEAYNKRKNEEALRLNDWQQTVTFNKKREFQTQYYNQLSDFTKSRADDDIDWEAKAIKQKLLNARQQRLRHLFDNDHKKYNEDRQKATKACKTNSHCSRSTYPEVEALEGRLKQLRERNESERKKMQEKLSYELWKNNSPELKQIEADRFNHFVQNAWIDQKQWKEDKKNKELEEIKKINKAALLEDEKHRKEQHKIQLQRNQRLDEWKSHLDDQVASLREKDAMQEKLILEEQILDQEKQRLDEIVSRRLRMQDLRKRKELELSWARQYQLKLKKKASNIIQELLSDQGIIGDLIGGHEVDQREERKKEAEWMKSVLEEQKRLELMREKEYDMLFSEEAERMWRRRQCDWEREQKARDKLMTDVIKGLKKQIDDKVSATATERQRLESERNECRHEIYNARQRLTREQEERINQANSNINFEDKSSVTINLSKEREEISQSRKEEERRLQEHRQEILRLEQEMKQLWGPKYIPPNYGRKKIAW